MSDFEVSSLPSQEASSIFELLREQLLLDGLEEIDWSEDEIESIWEVEGVDESNDMAAEEVEEDTFEDNGFTKSTLGNESILFESPIGK